MRSAKPASASRSQVRAKSSRPSSHPRGATSARTSSTASRPPRMRGSARMAAANTGGTAAASPVSRSTSTKFEAWNAASTRSVHCADAPLAASSARSTPTVARASLQPRAPASSSASAMSSTTSASAMHSTPICVISRACACMRPSASRNTRCM